MPGCGSRTRKFSLVPEESSSFKIQDIVTFTCMSATRFIYLGFLNQVTQGTNGCCSKVLGAKSWADRRWCDVEPICSLAYLDTYNIVMFNGPCYSA